MAQLTKELGARFQDLQGRAELDPDLGQRLHDDPRSVLMAEGIPTEGFSIHGEIDDQAGEVDGYLYRVESDCTCILYCPFCGRCLVADCVDV